MLRILLDLQALQSDSRHRGIGYYSRGLADALLRRADIEWHVLLSDAMPGTLLPARRWVRERVDPRRIHVMRGIGPTRGMEPGNAARARAAEALYAGFVSALAVDLVHVASPFDGWGDETVVDIAQERTTACAATVYDLIPFEEPELFLPTPLVSDWYHRRFEGLARTDVALAISEHTREVAVARLGLPDERVFAIGADVDPVFSPRTPAPHVIRTLKARYGITRPFLVHVGILEPRKNVPRLIEAFAALPEAVRASHQIVLVTTVTDAQRGTIVDLAHRLGLPADAVVMPGFVPDADLADLYALAEVTVMPSLNEGFGLPLLEAMRCGCPVLGSGTTSIPEVIGRPDLTFDPMDVAAMAERLHRMLTDRAFRADAVDHAGTQQALFSWDRSAERACEAFAEAVARRRVDGAAASRPTTALDLAGLAPAHYSLALGPYLTGTVARLPIPLPDELAACHAALVAEGPALLIDLTGVSALEAAGSVAQDDRVLPAVMAPNALATLRSAAGGVSRWTLAWHGWPRTRRVPPEPQTYAKPGDALADVLAHHPLARAAEPLARLRALEAETAFDLDEQRALAQALADNHAPAQALPRLLVDITELARHDARSGIQRVVRNILSELFAQADGFEVVAIRREEGTHRYARAFTARFLHGTPLGPDAIVDFRPTDTMLGLDFDPMISADAVANLQRQHLRGVRFVHVLYDTLPLHRPDWFATGMNAVYTQWLHTLAELSDGIACISQAVADDVARVFEERRILSGRTIAIGAFHLGADLDGALRPPAAAQTVPGVVDATHAVEMKDPDVLFEPSVPVFLTVGTLEPRKGHAQLLDAAEILWAAGSPAIVAIVGKRGWLVDALITRIQTHPELGRRLRWFEASDDAVLQQVYRSATAALLPSEGEGFGLPLVEAAHVGLPILARDLPVFREIGGAHATYFSGFTGAALAKAIEAWLEADAEGTAPRSTGIEPLTWAGSARQLLAFLQTVPHRP